KVEFGDDEDALAAEALGRNPLHILVAEQGATHPPLLPVIEQATEIADRLEARRDRLLDPFRRDDLLSAPRALVEHELADLCGIARAATKARGRGNPFIPVFHPFPVGDAQRDEQRLACERLQRLARYQ